MIPQRVVQRGLKPWPVDQHTQLYPDDDSEVQFYNHNQLEDTLHDANHAKEMVLQWKAHISRADNQDRGKTFAVHSLQNDTVFIVLDWAMKFTQMKY